jgi:hypothetical protein
LTLSVLLEPGIRNSSATRPSRTMLRSESIRLLPRLSGKTSVRSSLIETTWPGSPRGEQSMPSGPEVASATIGEASISLR